MRWRRREREGIGIGEVLVGSDFGGKWSLLWMLGFYKGGLGG